MKVQFRCPPGFAGEDEIPLIAEGAKEAVRRKRERDQRGEFIWLDHSGRPAASPLHGFMRGSVTIPPGVDLTEPVVDELFDAASSTLHR